MKALDIALKDLTQSFRSMTAIAFMFVIPLLITGLFFVMFSGIAGNEDEDAYYLPSTTVLVVNLDSSEANLGSILIDTLGNEALADLIEVEIAADAASARQAVDSQQAGVAVIIPENFSTTALESGEQTQIEIYRDPTLTIGPGIVSMVIDQFTDTFSGSQITIEITKEQIEAAGLTLSDEDLQKTAMTYIEVVSSVGGEQGVLETQSTTGESGQISGVNGIISMVMAGMLIFYAFFTGASSTQSILREEENYTLPRLFTTPTARRTILNGKFLATALTISIQVSVLFLFGALVFGFDWGSFGHVLLVVLGITATASAFGVFVMSFLKTQRQAGVVMGVAVTFTGMLGMSNIFAMTAGNPPAGAETLPLIVPQGWAIRALQTAMEHGSNEKLAASLAGLLVWGAVLFVIGNYRFNKRYA